MFSHRISPTNLYCLFSSRGSSDRRKIISARWLCNPQELGGEYMLPSIARSDPAFPSQEYWRGRIWPPMNYLVYEALQCAGMEEEKRLFAQTL